MNLDILSRTELTPEQIRIIKAGIADQLQAALNHRGVRDKDGRPIVRYSFLKKRHIKKIKFLRHYKVGDKNIYVRVI